MSFLSAPRDGKLLGMFRITPTCSSRRTGWTLLIALAASSAACGGGGADSPAAPSTTAGTGAQAPSPTPAPVAPTPATPSAPAPAPVTATGADPSCGLPNFQADALRLVNARRAAGASCGSRGSFAAAPALAWHASLATAAYAHSKDMADRNYFSHTGADSSTPATRASAAGYGWQSVGENIGAGYDTVQTVVDGWMASEGHCVNLMTATFVHMGLACANASSGSFDRYWTLVLARPG